MPSGTILHSRPVRSDDEISPSFLGRSLRHIRYWSLALAGAIIGIIPILLVVFVIVEFHALNDMIVKPDTDTSLRRDVRAQDELALKTPRLQTAVCLGDLIE